MIILIDSDGDAFIMKEEKKKDVLVFARLCV